MVEEQAKGFELIKRNVNEQDCWSARDLMPLLGYEKWETFSNVIKKAQIACANLFCSFLVISLTLRFF